MSNLQTVSVPDIGDYSDVPVIELLVAIGDQIGAEDPLLTLESDKAAMEVPSPVAGKVVEILVKVGSTVSRGSAVAMIECADVSTVEETGPAKAVDVTTKLSEPANTSAAARLPGSRRLPAAETSDAMSDAHASPSVRAFARELGIELSQIRPSGPKGRILRNDVQAWAKAHIQSEAVAGVPVARQGGLPSWPNVDFSKFGKISEAERTRIQTISAGNLHRNWLSIPHVTNFDRADVSELEDFRKQVSSEQHNSQPKLTMITFLIKASAIALMRHPRFNTSLEGEKLIKKHYFHVGFAADTPGGLMVPVIRDADQKTLLEIAGDVAEISGRARDGKLSAADMQGGCFTVSSLGGIGGDGFTPIINAPEVAILGAGRSSVEPVWDGQTFQPRHILPISLSWDHRVIDGVAAARFLREVAVILGDLRRAML